MWAFSIVDKSSAYGAKGPRFKSWWRQEFIKLSRGEICVANFKAPLQMGHLYKPDDWKTAESWPMLKVYWPQSYRVTDTQGYSVYGWVKFFVPDFNKLPLSLCSQVD